MLIGEGMRYDIACQDCAGDPDRLMTVCEGCATRADEYSRGEWLGSPEIRHRDRPVAGKWTTIECADVPLGDRCLAALPDGWLAWTAEGLVEITHHGERRSHGEIELPPEEPSDWEENRKPGLHTSPDGRFAAVVIEYGARGAVVDLSSDEVTLWLDRHDYNARTTPFPIAFARRGEDILVVAATEWNRLDVFEAATGRLLTDRNVEYRTPNYLDYFHGALALSPSGRWLYDDGWVWAPFGVRMVIDLEAWLAGDVYASEHAADVGSRDEWDHPMVWLDDETIAVQRLGHDWRNMLDGVQIIDVPSGRTLQTFAGPAGPMWAFERLLYVSAADGLEIWSPAEEARIGFVEGFRPVAQNPRTGALASLDGELRSFTPR